MRFYALTLGGCGNFLLPLTKAVCSLVDGENKLFGTYLTFVFIQILLANGALVVCRKTCLHAGCRLAFHILFGMSECGNESLRDCNFITSLALLSIGQTACHAGSRGAENHFFFGVRASYIAFMAASVTTCIGFIIISMSKCLNRALFKNGNATLGAGFAFGKTVLGATCRIASYNHFVVTECRGFIAYVRITANRADVSGRSTICTIGSSNNRIVRMFKRCGCIAYVRITANRADVSGRSTICTIGSSNNRIVRMFKRCGCIAYVRITANRAYVSGKATICTIGRSYNRIIRMFKRCGYIVYIRITANRAGVGGKATACAIRCSYNRFIRMSERLFFVAYIRITANRAGKENKAIVLAIGYSYIRFIRMSGCENNLLF